MIEIKHRYTSEVIFKADVVSIKLAVELAIKSRVSLSYADLNSADLSSANLRYADLNYANLRSVNLRSADLRYADLRFADLNSADLIVFQFQRHPAYYTFDGSLRIGCIFLPVTEWKDTFEHIGLKEGYNEEQILMYGQFINMCYKHFLRNNP